MPYTTTGHITPTLRSLRSHSIYYFNSFLCTEVLICDSVNALHVWNSCRFVVCHSVIDCVFFLNFRLTTLCLLFDMPSLCVRCFRRRESIDITIAYNFSTDTIECNNITRHYQQHLNRLENNSTDAQFGTDGLLRGNYRIYSFTLSLSLFLIPFPSALI